MTSFNIKQQVPTDIPLHGQYIPPENLESQKWLDNIDDWTKNQKMLINGKKTKTMVFNYTDKYQFTTRLQLNSKTVEVISSTKLLGTIIQDDLKWNMNTANIVSKANARMELLRKVASFGTSTEELKNVYILFIRSLLEQSATVWHSSLTAEDSSDLERVQKSALRVILGDKYSGYRNALATLDLDTLNDRRKQLCLSFAQKCLKNKKTQQMFPLNKNIHTMNNRNTEKFHVQHANTGRLKDSSIIYMQHLLNENEDSNKT